MQRHACLFETLPSRPIQNGSSEGNVEDGPSVRQGSYMRRAQLEGQTAADCSCCTFQTPHNICTTRAHHLKGSLFTRHIET